MLCRVGHREKAAEVMLLLHFVTHTCQALLWHPGMVLETHTLGKTSGKILPWNGGISPGRERPAQQLLLHFLPLEKT